MKSPCLDDAAEGRICFCSEAWKGGTCSYPTLRSTKSILNAATNIVALGNNDNHTIAMARDGFQFFKIPQPLTLGQGVNIRVCDSSAGSSSRSSGSVVNRDNRRALAETCPPSGKVNGCCCGDSCSDPDIYLSTQLPRSAYDFVRIRASPNGSTEVLTVYNTSTSGRYYLAIYANNEAEFLVEAKLTSAPPQGSRPTDNYFIQLLALWLTTETAGIIVLSVMCALTGILCAGCFCTACCSHENLHNSEGKTSWAGTFGRIIGSSQYIGKPQPPPPSIDARYRQVARQQAGRQMEFEMARQQQPVEILNPVGRGRRSLI